MLFLCTYLLAFRLRVFLQSCQWRRGLRVSGVLGAGSSELEKAAQRVTQLKKDPGNEAKLKLYALYKQVKCTLRI